MQQGLRLPKKELFKIKEESNKVPNEWHWAKYTQKATHSDRVAGAHRFFSDR